MYLASSPLEIAAPSKVQELKIQVQTEYDARMEAQSERLVNDQIDLSGDGTWRCPEDDCTDRFATSERMRDHLLMQHTALGRSYRQEHLN